MVSFETENGTGRYSCDSIPDLDGSEYLQTASTGLSSAAFGAGCPQGFIYQNEG